MISDPNSPKKLSANEGIKERSNFLRGTILESLSDESTGSISADDAQLTKFHGTYMQDDRDLRASLIKAKKEKAFYRFQSMSYNPKSSLNRMPLSLLSIKTKQRENTGLLQMCSHAGTEWLALVLSQSHGLTVSQAWS